MKLKQIETYMNMAKCIAVLSKDSQTQVGCVLINKNNKQIASGYNGFVRGAVDDLLPNTRPDKYDYIIHAEINTLLNSMEDHIDTRGCTLICTLSPCLACLRFIYQSGISDIIFEKLYLSSIDVYREMKDIYVLDKPRGKYTHLSLFSATKGCELDLKYKDMIYGKNT